jgi:hypothetical protein
MFLGSMLAVSFAIVRGDLIDPVSRQRYIDRLRTPRYIDIYKGILTRSLAALDWLFGGRNISQTGYLVCTAISFVYSILGFIVAWVAGASGMIGKTLILPDDWDSDDRFTFTLFLCFACVFLYLFGVFPYLIVKSMRFYVKKLFRPSYFLRQEVSTIVLLSTLAGIYLYSDNVVMPILFFFSFLTLGIWYSTLALLGGIAVGISASLFSGLDSYGSQRFLAGIAVLAASSLGASRGTGPVAAIRARFCLRTLRLSRGTVIPRKSIAVLKFILPTLISAAVGATGGAAFVAAAAYTYSSVVGSQLDSSLIQTLGFSSSSPVFPIGGALFGFVGGALVSRFGQGGFILGAAVSVLLLAIAFNGHLISTRKLYNYFETQSFVGTAMINVLLFFVFLPQLNAIWDWLAWEASRQLARRLLVKITGLGILLHVGIAAFIGSTLIIGLVCSATIIFTVFNKWMLLHTGTIPLPIDDVARAAMEHPFGAEGIWIGTMIFSTLLPTFFHLVFVVFGVLLMRTPEQLRSTIARQLTIATSPAEMHGPIFYFAFLPFLGTLFVLVAFSASCFIFARSVTPISHALYALVHWLST